MDNLQYPVEEAKSVTAVVVVVVVIVPAVSVSPVVTVASVMFELNEARKASKAGYIRMNAFDASYGTESCACSFIVSRPAFEPGFFLDRTDSTGRQQTYSIKSYSVAAAPESYRYNYTEEPA